jgi:hypothetical protein
MLLKSIVFPTEGSPPFALPIAVELGRTKGGYLLWFTVAVHQDTPKLSLSARNELAGSGSIWVWPM